MKVNNKIKLVKLKKNNLKIFKENLKFYFNEINKSKLDLTKIKLISSNILKKKDYKFIINYKEIFIGFIILEISKNISNEKICAIKDFFIVKKYRGKSLGKNVILIIQKYLKERKIKKIKIEILKTNNSVEKFWKKFKIKTQKTTYIFNT